MLFHVNLLKLNELSFVFIDTLNSGEFVDFFNH